MRRGFESPRLHHSPLVFSGLATSVKALEARSKRAPPLADDAGEPALRSPRLHHAGRASNVRRGTWNRLTRLCSGGVCQEECSCCARKCGRQRRQ